MHCLVGDWNAILYSYKNCCGDRGLINGMRKTFKSRKSATLSKYTILK